MKSRFVFNDVLMIGIDGELSDKAIDEGIKFLYQKKIEKAFNDFENTAHVKPLPKKLKAALSC